MATFTNLARGTGTWDGHLELSVDLSPTNDRMVSAEFTSLPVLVQDDVLRQKQQSVRRQPRMMSACCARSFRGEHELLLPKTYTTRKGALVLFTPPGEFSLTEFDKGYLNKAFSDNYIDYVNTFGSLAHLAQSVLMYGDNENEEEDMSLSDIPNRTHMKFLHTPHDNMIDTRSQPGGDVSRYLYELRSTRCSTTSSYKAMSDDGRDTKVEQSWPGDTMTSVATSEMVTVGGDTLIGHDTTPVSHVTVSVSPVRPQSLLPMSSRQVISGEKTITSVKLHPCDIGETILEVATPREPPSRAPTPVMQTSLAESMSYQSSRSSLSTSDGGSPAEMISNQVGSLDDLDLYPPCDGVQAIAGSRTDYSDDLSVHSQERSTLGGMYVNVGDAAQPLLPVYGGTFQANGGRWFAHETSPCQLMSASVSSDGSVRDDAETRNVIKVEVTSHPSSDVSSAATVSSKPAEDMTGQRRSEKGLLSRSRNSSEQWPHPPTNAAMAPGLFVRPPYPPSTPMSASRRSSIISVRSYQSGGSNAKTYSDITETNVNSESSSTHILNGTGERRRNRSKSTVQRETVNEKSSRLSYGQEAEGIALKSVTTKSDGQMIGVGLDVDKQTKLVEGQAGDMVAEVGYTDKMASEEDNMAATGGSETGLEDNTLKPKSSKVEIEVKQRDLTDMKSTVAEKGEMPTKTTEADSLLDITKEVTHGIKKETDKKSTFEKIVKKKVIKKTRKAEEARQKRMSIIAEKDALRESRRLLKQQALEEMEEIQRQAQEKEEAKEKMAEEKAQEKKKILEQLAEVKQLAEAKAAEKKAKEAARKVAKEEREERRKAEAEQKKEAAVRRRSEHRLLQEAARQKEVDMLMKIAMGEQKKKDAVNEGRRRRTEDGEMARMKEEEEHNFEMMMATQRDVDRLAELQMKAEIDEMNRLIQEKEDADKRTEMIQREADRLQNTDFDLQMAIVERQLAEHEDAELRRLVQEQKVVRAEIERRQKLQQEEEEQVERERRDVVTKREMTVKRQSYNLEQSTHLHNVRVKQSFSRPWTFSYYVAWPLATYSKFGSYDVQGKGKRKKSGKKGKKGRKHKK